MPEMRIEADELLRQAAEPEQLLALHGLRRCVEPRPHHRAAARMVATMTPEPPHTLELTLIQLMELVAAIDRRLPQVHRLGETAIANAAALLRNEAAKRIAEIEVELTAQPTDAGRADVTY